MHTELTDIFKAASASMAPMTPNVPSYMPGCKVAVKGAKIYHHLIRLSSTEVVSCNL